MERQKLCLVEHIVMVVFCAATSALILQHETHANEPRLEKPITTILPENLSQRWRELRFLDHQPEQILLEISTPVVRSRLASVEDMPQPKFTAVDTLKALDNASPLIQCVVAVEIGHPLPGYEPFDPNMVGEEGELGPAQLHPKGKLPRFYQEGNTNPKDPYQAIPFIEKQIALGDGNHWAGIRDGIC